MATAPNPGNERTIVIVLGGAGLVGWYDDARAIKTDSGISG